MLSFLKSSWALLLGILLLMVGNGMQGTLLGIRGEIEGYTPQVMSYVMSAYFAGFLGGSRLTPLLIRRVGHVRVFAALASLISAAFIGFAAIPDPVAWSFLRLLVGFCFSGVYVVAESWLNESATNETRGKALSAYLIVQLTGIVAAQALLNIADPAGFLLFAFISICVSVSFAPILLSAMPAPAFQATKPMSLLRLYRVSPLGCVGIFLLGGIFSLLFGMAPVFAAEIGLTVAQISMFIGSIYLGGMLMQYPIGYFSDRMDRRVLIVGTTAVGALAALFGAFVMGSFTLQLVAAFIIGGIANPLYSLLIAHTNDFLEPEDMASASGGLIFINGVGAIGAPIILGWVMTRTGPAAFYVFVAAIFAMVVGYGLYRMTQRPTPHAEDTTIHTPVSPTASPVAFELAQEIVVEQAQEDDLSET